MKTERSRPIHVQKKEDFDRESASGNIPESGLVFIQDSKEMSTHSSLYSMVSWTVIKSSFIDSSKAVAGDILLYDSVKDATVICPKGILQDVDTSRYEPIGIVVIPGSHDVYGDNRCGVMSVKAMDCSSPDTGSFVNQAMCASKTVDVATGNYNQVVVWENGALVGKGFGYLPKDGAYASTTYRIPNPYNPDGTRNPDYYDLKSVPRNGMADFSGKDNTAVNISTRGVKDYSTWKPSPKTAADFPAFSCCDMFAAPGTVQGEWYLPAMGEIGYIMPKWSEILGTISMINSMFGDVASPIVDGDCLWSSTEYSGVNLRYVHTSNGAGHSAKATALYYVRAFIII